MENNEDEEKALKNGGGYLIYDASVSQQLWGRLLDI